MIELIKDVKNFQATPIEQYWDKQDDQVLAYGRKDLVFVFNFNPSKSFRTMVFWSRREPIRLFSIRIIPTLADSA